MKYTNKNIKFARIGGLSPVIQEGYSLDNISFHSPPARKGIYAFIYPHIYWFLLSGKSSSLGNKNKHEKFEYYKDVNGNKILIYDNVHEGDINPKLKKHIRKGKCENYKRDEYGEISSKLWQLDIRDENGDYVNSFAIKKKKMKVFEYTGELWHHLKNKAIRPSDIIDEKGSWIKTDYETFCDAFYQDKLDCIKQLKRSQYNQIQINPRNVYNYISKDHLEVFIERIY